MLGQAGASPDKPTPLTGTRLLLMDGQPRCISLRLCLWTCPSLHLLSLSLVSCCASGNATGHPGRYPPCGVPRWVQVPEGVVYATITLGTACPRAGMPVIPVPAAWLMEAGCMPEGGRHPLPALVCGSCMRMPCVTPPQIPACGIWKDGSRTQSVAGPCRPLFPRTCHRTQWLRYPRGAAKRGLKLSERPAFPSCLPCDLWQPSVCLTISFMYGCAMIALRDK